MRNNTSASSTLNNRRSRDRCRKTGRNNMIFFRSKLRRIISSFYPRISDRPRMVTLFIYKINVKIVYNEISNRCSI
jgi:hypothetical protein